MASRMAHRVAIDLLRKITNRTRDRIKGTEQRVWYAGRGGLHPNDDVDYWYTVREVAQLSMIDGEALYLLAQEQIRQLEA